MTREYEENGLRLYSTINSVEPHQGKIWMESGIYRESNFNFTLPVFSLQSRENIKPKKDAFENLYKSISISIKIQDEKVNYKPETKRKILIVANDGIKRQVLINHLSNENYSIKILKNTAEVLDNINNEKFDLILIDMGIPKASAFELCKKIRQYFNSYELPVIMLTSKNKITGITGGFNAGLNDYIVEPFDKEELLSRINTLVSLKEAVVQIDELKNNIETIVSNIPEGIVLFNPELEISYANDRFKQLFNIQGDIVLSKLFNNENYNNIRKFVKNKKDKFVFEWIIGTETRPVLINIIFKFINEKFILMLVSEIKNILTEKEMQTCYYIIRGYSERETAKILYKSRTTVNSNKVRARDKLKQNGYTSMLRGLK